MSFVPRGVIEEHAFTAQYDKLLHAYPRLADVKIALDWTLARNPTIGQPIVGNYYILKTSPIGLTPSFRVLYQIVANPGDIALVAIAAEEIDPEE